MLQYKSALTAVIDDFNPIISAGKLTQKWIVDSYLQVEANSLNFIRAHQQELRTELYKGLANRNSSNPVLFICRISTKHERFNSNFFITNTSVQHGLHHKKQYNVPKSQRHCQARYSQMCNTLLNAKFFKTINMDY
ncbi:hypothetical protein AVEN_21528-1 [Araneus ventricosus]|uniref:Helitron helicase-like domain-containing protein n=1 Tax=Araneus ventricosus TaxID=182803 RepID=A0A4Y2TES8_ARAVE|nr:hypothetical protein AVEN_21528-1 [Araneus ventricosus]